MSSQESLGTYDPFFAQRMAPVIIAGGEVVENRNTSSELTRTESNQSSAFRRPSIESRNSSQVSLSANHEEQRKTLWPSPFPRGHARTASSSSRQLSESSDNEALAMKPTLALRRSIQRLQSGGQEPPRLPKPIVTRAQVVSPAMTSFDTTIMSDDSMFDPSAAQAVATKETDATTTSGPKRLLRRARSPHKWNIFGRSHKQPVVEKKEDTSRTVAATVKVVQSKPVAFYTMMDSSEDSGPVDLEELLSEARGIAISTPEPDLVVEPETPSPPRPQHAEQQRPAIPQQAVTAPVTLPIPLAPEPKLAPKPERAPAQQHVQQVPVPRHAPARPSRLPQVGRIPKVVSARAEHISPKSFSRPFHRLSVHLAPVRPNVQDEESVAKGPSPTKPSTPEPLYEEPLPADESHFAALVYGVPRLSPPPISPPRREFLSFSPRKDSQGTTTTCSSSSGGINSYAVATAVVPEPNAPLAEDEIWDEYNDLLGEETMRFSKAEVPSWPKPLRLEGSAKARVKLIPPPLESPTLSPPPLPSLVATLRAGMEHTSLSVRGSDVALEVKRMLDYGPTPETSMVFRDSVCSQDEKAQTVDASKQPEEPVPAQRNSCSSVHQTRRSDASGSTQGSEDSSPLAQVNLRVGSMTVSKWLTFGHVLFSPVRDELISDVGSLKRPSILVVDGLGNDDWSFYAAETYPAATFFNLSPRAPLPAEHRNETSFPLSPPNHHQVQYLSHTAKFPFGAQSFTAVVFRFPVAAPEGHYRNIISEARRVLATAAAAPLASTSDLILRLIGRRGFQDVKTCRVGVPVASAIARTSSSGGSRDSVGKRNSVTASGLPKQDKKLKAKRDDRSLPEMINDESPVADASIAQSVARVGRWWYSRCYESPVVTMAPGAEPSTLGASIWRDKALLAECQAWGTSLKLMVCHARVPDGRARVASI
ncbi:hypothetical protein N0V88_002223 [Collariella sp. IMI 366227]|nr:hypothetical protein N0V88_002223 [Collariella sp. IMI 366227]